MSLQTMHTARASASIKGQRGVAVTTARTLLLLVWQAVRSPIFALLVIFEPIVRIVLSSLTLLAFLTAFLFESSSVAPGFPFWVMIALSVGCAVVLTGNYALLRLFSK